MKKLISVLAVLTILFTVTACSNNNKTDKTENKTEPATTEQANTLSDEEQIKTALTNYFTALYTGNKEEFLKYRSSYGQVSFYDEDEKDEPEIMSDDQIDQLLKETAKNVKEEYGENIEVEIPDSDESLYGAQIGSIDEFLNESGDDEDWYTATLRYLKDNGITKVAIVDGYINLGGDKQAKKTEDELMMIDEFSAIVVFENSEWKVLFF